VKKIFACADVTTTRDADARSNARARDLRSRPLLTAQWRRCKKSLFHRAFCNTDESPSTICIVFIACTVALRLLCVNDAAARGGRARYTLR
jgi:hypothetical protein